MSTFKEIRALLGMTQSELAEELGCTQGRVWQMDHGGTVMPDTAEKLVQLAANKKRCHLTLDQVYGRKPLPKSSAKAA